MKQIILAILSRAGGVGKTTLAANIAYELSRKGITVAMLDLDANHSLEDFVGLEAIEENDSIVNIFSKKFSGNWKLQSIWGEPKLQVCQGHPEMANLVDALSSRTRKEYVLRTLLQKYPLPHKVVILDCPGTQSLMTTNALAASTHLLIPIQLEVKIKTVPELITWCSEAGEELELEPKPLIMGIIPNNYNKEASLHRQNLEQLPAIARAMGIKLYPEIPSLKYRLCRKDF